MKIPDTLRSRHRLLGLILLLPFIAWSLTALFFLVQPGYGDAYQIPQVKTYPLERSITLPANPNWLETRYLRTVLGEHLLVRTDSGWHHLRGSEQTVWPLPPEDTLARLIRDAVAEQPDRYGTELEVSGNTAVTDTGVELAITWNTLSLSQRGRDTRWIDRLYSIHYLQWTGIALLDGVLGITGLSLLLFITYTGGRLALFGRAEKGKP